MTFPDRSLTVLCRPLVGLVALAVLVVGGAETASGQCPITEIHANDPQSSVAFGEAVDFDGATLLAGAHLGAGANGSGAVYVFVGGGANWTQQQKLLPSVGPSPDWFGRAVALHGDRAVIGAPRTSGVAGAHQGMVYVFERSGTTWAETAKIVALDPDKGDLFGYSVALDGTTMVVGAVDDLGFGGQPRGSAYVLVESGGVWLQQAKLLPSDGQEGDAFGSAVGISGDTVVVGAAGNDAHRGAVYVYERTGTSWTEKAKLVAAEAMPWDSLGGAVAIEGDIVVSGARDAEGARGAAYVHRRSGGVWTQEARLLSWDRHANDFFGTSVAIDAPFVVVGARGGPDMPVAYGGAVQVFVDHQGEWRDRADLVVPDLTPGDYWGSGVAVSGEVVVAMSPKRAVNGVPYAGAAYFFDPKSYGDGYGAGCAGTGAVVPGLRIDGCPADGVLDLRVHDGLGPSFGYLLLGSTETSAPIGGACDLLVAPVLPLTIPFQLVGFGPGIGDFELFVPIPSNTPAGTVTIQAAIFDPFAAPGFSVTNGVTLAVP